jgi:alpha-L-rhamnosidase
MIWKTHGSQITLNINVPASTSATVYVPTTDVASVLEGGRPAAEADSVDFVKAIEHAAVYQVGSGQYRFAASWAVPSDAEGE